MHEQQEKRLQRIELVFKFVEKNQPVRIEQIIRNFDYISRKTLREYLNLLMGNDRIQYNIDGFYVK